MTEQMIAQQAWYVKSKVMRVETFILLEPTSAVMVLIHCFLTCISTDMIERGLRRQPSTDSCALDDAEQCRCVDQATIDHQREADDD